MTLTRTEIIGLMEQNDIRPSRSLGQNFVADPNTVRRIARLSGVGPDDQVLEIGAGLGCLTLALADTGAHVTAIETDRRLIPVLRQVVEPAGVTVVHADAMALDWGPLLADRRWTLVANLPYNVGTPLVADLLDGQPSVERMLVLVQREVAERLAAGPGDDAYGALSVKVRYWSEARVLGRVPASVFIPRPNVESALVEIKRRPSPAVDPALVDAGALFALVRAGFGQRRKMLRRSLAELVTPAAFDAAHVDSSARAEELDVADWGRLAAASAAAGGASASAPAGGALGEASGASGEAGGAPGQAGGA